MGPLICLPLKCWLMKLVIWWVHTMMERWFVTSTETILIILNVCSYKVQVGLNNDFSAVPCPQNRNIMSPDVPSGSNVVTWSECTQRMIDAEYEERGQENCFLTWSSWWTQIWNKLKLNTTSFQNQLSFIYLLKSWLFTFLHFHIYW